MIELLSSPEVDPPEDVSWWFLWASSNIYDVGVTFCWSFHGARIVCKVIGSNISSHEVRSQWLLGSIVKYV
jgi:hypothetical protein